MSNLSSRVREQIGAVDPEMQQRLEADVRLAKVQVFGWALLALSLIGLIFVFSFMLLGLSLKQ